MAGCIYTIDGREFDEEGLKKYIADNLDQFAGDLGLGELTPEAKGITHAANEIRRRALEMGERDTETVSMIDANREAQMILSKGDYNVDKLLDKALISKDLSPVEIEIVKIAMAALDAEIAKKPTNDLINKQKRLINIGDMVGSEAGRKLAFRKGMAAPMSTISEFYVNKMEKNKVNELTDQQMAEAKADFEKKMSAEKDVADKKAAIDKFENDEVKKLAQENLDKQKKTTPKVKRDFVAERKSVIDSIKDKWKKAGKEDGTLSAVPLPISPRLAKQLVEVSPDVAKLMKLYIEEGVSELGDLVNKIYDDLKDIEGLKKSDTVDLIAGRYNKKKETKNELQLKVADLKKEADLLSKIEDVKNGVPKTEKETVRKNQRITALQNELADLKKETPGYYDLQKINNAINRVQSDIKKTQERIANKDFAEKPKYISIAEDRELRRRNPKLYNSYLDAIEKKDKTDHEYQMKMADEAMNAKTIWKRKLAEGGQIGKETLNTVKALKAGIDNSAVFVQSGIAVMNPMNYKATLKALASQPSQFISEGNFRRRILEVHANEPLWNMIQESGLDYIDPRGYAKEVHEEQFGGKTLLERVKIGDKDLSKYTTAPFERLFTGFTNEFRLQLFIKGANELMEDGLTIDKNPQEYKDLASYVNNITGRGKLKKELQGQTENVISSVIWAPKLMASSLNMIGLGDIANLRGNIGVEGASKGYYGNMTPRMRKYAIKNTAAGIGTGVLLMAAYAMQPNKEVDFDPESVTFGQIKDTKTGWAMNPFGRLTPIVRYLSMMIMAAKSIGGKPIKFNPIMESYKFIRGKMAPITGIGTDILMRRDFQGKPYSLGKVKVADVIEPMFVNDMVQQAQIDGTAALLYAIPTFYGMKVTNEKMYDKRDLQSLLDNTQNSAATDKNLMVNYNNGAKPITSDEFKEFVKKNDDLIGTLIKNVYDNGVPIEENGNVINKPIKDLTKDELSKEMIRLKSLATAKVKKDLFGEKEPQDEYIKKEIDYLREEQGIGKQKEE